VLSKPEKRIPPRRFFQIQCNTAFGTVRVQEKGPHTSVAAWTNMANDISFRSFDLDHFSAEVTHGLGRERPHEHTCKIKDANSRQRSHDEAACHLSQKHIRKFSSRSPSGSIITLAAAGTLHPRGSVRSIAGRPAGLEHDSGKGTMGSG